MRQTDLDYRLRNIKTTDGLNSKNVELRNTISPQGTQSKRPYELKRERGMKKTETLSDLKVGPGFGS